ncbi:MAG: phosphoenolpyruvate carboxykinase (ATP), partial [Bacteroidia bacterium]
TAALEGQLDSVEYGETPFFKLRFPKSCPGVPSEILEPRNTWADKAAFDAQATDLAAKFVKNFEQYESGVSQDVLNAAPRIAAVNA